MTTEITREANPRLPAPANYARHVDTILSRAHPSTRRLWLAGAASAVIVLGLIAIALATLFNP